MNKDVYKNLEVIWNYMHMNMQVSKADCIIGFGNINTDIPKRCAELYNNKYADKIIFSGGLGRNTDDIWNTSEAKKFAQIAVQLGVLESDIMLEEKSANTGENILFTQKLLEEYNLKCSKIIFVHQQFMERRIYAALKIYWPNIEAIVTSPQTGIEEYIACAKQQGLNEKTAVEVIVGDFQRIEIYAKKGYQIPQHIPKDVNDAFKKMVDFGYVGQLITQ